MICRRSMGEDSFRVGEMFAGVGGFRLGLVGPPSKDWETEFLKFEETGFKVVWSNQWEPASKAQHASDIYIKRFGPEGHSNEDIETVPADKVVEPVNVLEPVNTKAPDPDFVKAPDPVIIPP